MGTDTDPAISIDHRTRTAAVVDGVEVPLAPPAEWFTPPAGGIPTERRVTIDAGGRVYGYIAMWNACHVGMDGCVPPPQGSPSDYALAHPGETMTAEGDLIPTGNIGGSVGHAPDDLDAWNAASWYDNSATQLMRVQYGEDDTGLWFAGALWPHITEQGIAELRASSISGDWRWEAAWRNTDGGGYDYTGAVLVNHPGFPIEAGGGVSTEAGFLQSIAASARRDGFHGIVAVGDTYITTDTEGDTMTAASTAQADTTSTTADAGGGCGCGGGKAITAGAFDGSVDDLVTTIVEHVVAALAAAGVRDDASPEPAAADAQADDVQADAAPDEPVTAQEGEYPMGGDVEALNMKLDAILQGIEEIRVSVAAGEVEALAARLTRTSN